MEPPPDSPRDCASHAFVSVIVCTRGSRKTLEDCLDSLRHQTCRQYEIILVANTPTNEGSLSTLAQPPVRLRHETTPGVCLARNHAIPFAKGEILAFCDDDVVAEHDWLHELLRGLEDPKVACVTGRVIPEGPLTIPLATAKRYYHSEHAHSVWYLDSSDPECYRKALNWPAGFGCNMAFRKSFLERQSGFPEDLGAGAVIPAGDEFYMFLQVLKNGFRISHIPSAAVTHAFPRDLTEQKAKTAKGYAAAVAFTTKLLIEDAKLRQAILKWLLAGIRTRLRRILARKSLSPEPQEVISTAEKILACFRGPLLYLKSRVARSRRPIRA